MAVQQNKKSPSKRNMRRAHDYLTTPSVHTDKATGSISLRHHIDLNTGYYKGKKVIKAGNDD